MPFSLKPWLVRPYREIAAAASLGRAPASIIIAGDPDYETASLALALTRLYLCREPGADGLPCERCPSCRRLSGGAESSPAVSLADFLAVLSTTREEFDRGGDLSHRPCDLIGNSGEAAGTVLRIDSLRRLSEWAVESRMGGRGKAAVISNAHLMPPAAQNAILKTFEEPPGDTVIIMLARSLDTLLPTILSRACKLVVPPPAEKEALDDLSAGGTDLTRAREALALCAGSPRAARRLIGNGLVGKFLDLIKVLEGCVLGERSGADFIRLLTDGARTRGAAPFPHEQACRVLSQFLRSLLKYKAGMAPGALPLLNGLDLDALSRVPAEALFAALEDLSVFRAGAPVSLKAPRAFYTELIGRLRQRRE